MNNELHIGGNSYGPNAVGHGARAVQRDVQVSAAGDELREILARLRASIEENRDHIPEADRARRDVDELEREVQQEDPDPERMRDATQRIVARVGMVGAVLGVANSARELVEGLIH